MTDAERKTLTREARARVEMVLQDYSVEIRREAVLNLVFDKNWDKNPDNQGARR